LNDKRRSTVFGLLVAVAATLLLTFATAASATPIQDKKAQARAVMAQLDQLNAKMEVAVEAYDNANEKLAVVNDKISDNEKALKTARFNLMVARSTLEARAIAMYKRQAVDLLDVMLSSSSFDELISQVDMLNRLGESDVNVVDSIQGYEKQITAARTGLQSDRAAAVKLVSEASAHKAQVEASLAQRQSMLKGIEDQIAALERQREAQSKQLATTIDTDTGAAPGPPAAGIVGIAAQYLGVPYVYGGATPAGFDCSGFTMYVYGKAGIPLAHNAAAQQASCTPVSRDQAVPGDLVFFGSPAHHVGIYCGGSTMIHAPYTGAVVRYDTIYSDVSGFGRP
jgi:peptidoglycan DL-endopeptidase CwlO